MQKLSAPDAAQIISRPIEMNISKWLVVLVLAQLTGCADAPVQEKQEVALPNGQKLAIINLGNDQFKIGNITIDKAGRSFEIPGKLLRNVTPIEFLAVAKNGQRGYESLLEFDANVYEFNLACILIGLDQNKGIPPKAHFDTAVIQGDAVDISLSWKINGEEHKHPASDFFLLDNKKLAESDWVYTGSTFSPKGDYLADAAGGTLIGFVHDPASIIEHGHGFNSQSYGSLELNTKLMPALNTPIKATLKFVGNTKVK
jgi:hypothetical protein